MLLLLISINFITALLTTTVIVYETEPEGRLGAFFICLLLLANSIALWTL